MAKKSLLRRALIVVGVLVALVGATIGWIAYSAFGGIAPVVDGKVVVPGIRVIKDGFVSVGFIDAGYGQLALVDCGNDPHAAAIIDVLSKQSRTPADVRTIFLTHGHADHTKGCAMFPRATIIALKDDVELVAGREGGHGMLTRMMPVKPTGLTVAHPATDGERIDVGTRRVLVYAVPGHTAGSAAFLVDGALFIGDSAGVSKDGKIRPAPAAFSDDSSLNRASLRALGARLQASAEPVTALVPSHTGVLEKPTVAAELTQVP